MKKTFLKCPKCKASSEILVLTGPKGILSTWSYRCQYCRLQKNGGFWFWEILIYCLFNMLPLVFFLCFAMEYTKILGPQYQAMSLIIGIVFSISLGFYFAKQYLKIILKQHLKHTKDRVPNILSCVIIFVTVFLILPVDGRAEKKDVDMQYQERLTNYYKKPEPQIIPETLEYFASSSFVKEQSREVISTLAFLFARIAQQEPALIPKYLSAFSKSKHEGRLFILMTLELCGNEQVVAFLKEKVREKRFKLEKDAIEESLKNGIPVKFDLLSSEVKTALDVDFLWAEFFVTGKKDPLEKIVDVVVREDRFRKKLTAWMNKKHSQLEMKRSGELFNQQLPFDLDFAKAKIQYPGDLDAMYSSFLLSSGIGGAPSKKALEIKKMLALTQEDIDFMNVKAAALWSLRASVNAHPLVREVCAQQNKTLSLSAQYELQELGALK